MFVARNFVFLPKPHKNISYLIRCAQHVCTGHFTSCDFNVPKLVSVFFSQQRTIGPSQADEGHFPAVELRDYWSFEETETPDRKRRKYMSCSVEHASEKLSPVLRSCMQQVLLVFRGVDLGWTAPVFSGGFRSGVSVSSNDQ